MLYIFRTILKRVFGAGEKAGGFLSEAARKTCVYARVCPSGGAALPSRIRTLGNYKEFQYDADQAHA